MLCYLASRDEFILILFHAHFFVVFYLLIISNTNRYFFLIYHRTLSASVNVSTSATTKIEKLFSKHPRKEEHNINEKYVKHLQHEIESKHREIGWVNVKILICETFVKHNWPRYNIGHFIELPNVMNVLCLLPNIH